MEHSFNQADKVMERSVGVFFVSLLINNVVGEGRATYDRYVAMRYQSILTDTQLQRFHTMNATAIGVALVTGNEKLRFGAQLRRARSSIKIYWVL